MRTNVTHVTSANMLCYFGPVLAELHESFQKQLVFVIFPWSCFQVRRFSVVVALIVFMLLGAVILGFLDAFFDNLRIRVLFLELPMVLILDNELSIVV